MGFKKKVLTTTLAASLVIGSISGLPLSTKGVADKLGLSTSIVEAATIQGDLGAVWTELQKDSEAVNKVKAVSAAIEAALAVESDSYFADFVAPVMDKINAELGSAPGDNADMGRALFEIIASLAYPAGENENRWEAALGNAQLRAVVADIAQLAGGTFVEADLDEYISAFEEELSDSLDLDSVIKIFTDNQGGLKATLFGLATDAFDALSTTTVLGGIFGDLNITGDDLLDSYKNIAAQFDQGGEGILSLGAALGRLQLDYTKTEFDNGRTLQPKLGFRGFTIPNALLDWTVVSGSNVTFDKDSGAFKLDTSVNTATVTVEARDNVSGQDLLAYKGEIKMTYTGSSYTGGGGGFGGGGTTTPPSYVIPGNIEAIASQAEAALAAVGETLQSLSQDDRNLAIAALRTELEQMITELAQVNVTSSMNIVDNQATATIDAAVLDKELKALAETIAKLNADLKSLDPTAAALKTELTLDLGDIDVDNMDMILSKDVLDVIKANGMSHVAVKVNGASIVIAVADFDGEVKVTMNKQPVQVAEDATNQRVVSDVYELSISVDGERLTSFNTPVELRLPFNNQLFIDKELLTLAKIVDGMIIVYGGMYNTDSGTVNGSRDQFSVYTVIENKVVFNDIASVQSWAGRHIQVAAAKGIINGRDVSQFVPQESVTRAEFAKMIVLTFGLEDAQATHSFVDVQSTDWFSDYVASAVKAGVVNGRSANTFEPNGTITRAEMATMAARALVITGKAKYLVNAADALDIFTDQAEIHSTMSDSVALAAKLGIVIGENNAFNPNDASTRAQAAVVIYRLLNQ